MRLELSCTFDHCRASGILVFRSTEFRARVPQSLQAEFEKKFLSVSVPYVEAAAGLVSVSVARPTRWIPDEYAMISIWHSEDDVAAFAGDDWNRAVIPAGMEKYVAECWVHHYENFR